MHWQPKSLAQIFCERLHLVRLDPFSAAHAQGKSDHNLPHVILLNHLLQLLKVVSFISALQRLQPLRRNPKRIRHRHPDSSRPNIEAKNPPHRHLPPVPVLGAAGFCLAREWALLIGIHAPIIVARLSVAGPHSRYSAYLTIAVKRFLSITLTGIQSLSQSRRLAFGSPAE